MFGKILGKLIGGDTGAAIIGYFSKKQELKQNLALAKLQGKIDVQKAADQYRAQQLQSDTALSQAQLESKGNWLRQDWVLALLSVPLVLVFVPPFVPYVEAGFAALDKCPGWYRYLVVAVFAAIYGIRGVASLFNKK